MAEKWATSGLDLHLELSRAAAAGGVRAGLEDALRAAIRGSRLPAGTRLPSSRALASDLGLARNTVADAYGQLVAEGWLSTRHGAGTWVAEHGLEPQPPGGTAVSQPERRIRYDLRAGFPDVSAFPRPGWLAASRRALAAAPAKLLGYGDPRGPLPLRTALAGYLSRARGVITSPDRIVVCAGFAQGLELLCEVLRARGGATLATEAYGHAGHRQIAAVAGLSVAPVAVDEDAAVTSELGSCDAVLLIPAHQFPLGMPLAPARRRQVTEWAARTGAVIIEDDYDGEFRFDRPSVGALQALAPDRVVYAGTASKGLAPGLRLGWLMLPGQLLDEVLAAKARASRLSSSLDQLTLAELIDSGGYDRQIRRMRLAYRRRRDQLVAMLARQAPQVRVTGMAAGLHALARLPAGQQEDEVVASAARHQLAVDGLSSYGPAGHPASPALVVGYGTPPAHAFTAALARLGAVLSGDPA
jgi:GntR family transcriptional regulator/MocR family aminotransferase